MAKDGTIKINTELDSTKAQSAMAKFSGFSKSALKGVAVAAGAVGTAMGAVAGYAIKVGSDFEAGMSKVSAISGATGDNLDALSDKAKEMGAKTKFSATEAASAFEYMAMAGWKTEDMLNGIEGVMNLAAASGEDLARVSDIVTDAITAFGLSASDSAHFADVLAKAASSSNTNIGMMGATFKYAAPISGALKYSIEDTATAIGLMANAGIKGEQAGTSLRAMLTRLVDPPKEAAGALEALGISVTNADGTMKPLMETIKDLRSGFANLDDSQKASYASSIAGQEAMSGLLAIVGASDADFNSLVASINDADGAAQSMAETMQDNLQGSLTILGSSLEGFGIKVYEKMQGPLKAAADTGIECVERLSNAFDSGGLHGVVEKAGDIFNELANKIADTSDEADGIITPLKNMAKSVSSIGKTVGPLAIKAISSLAKNMDKLIPLAIAGYTAFKVLGTATKASTTAMKASAAVTAILTGESTAAAAATGLFTKAQLALTTAIKANPIGLAVTAIAALTAGTIAYIATAEDNIEKTYGLTDAEKENLTALQECTDSLKMQREAREESIASIDKEYSGYENLLGELQSITDANGNVKAGYEERAKVITGMLSEALGIEIELLDGQIQKYGEVVKAIEEVILKKEAEAVLSSMQEDMANAYKNTEDAINKYKDAASSAAKKDEQVKELTKAKKQAQEDYDKALKEGSETALGYGHALNQAEKKLKAAKDAQKDANEEVRDAKTKMEELSAEVDNYRALQEAVASGDSAKIQEALNTLVSSYRSYTSEALSASEETRNALYEQANGYVENLSLIQDGTIKVADEIYGQMADAAAKTIDNFNQLPGGIAKGIQDIGPEAGAAMLSALAQADLDGKLNDEGKASLQALVQAYDTLPSKMQSKFESAVEGAMEGLEGFDKIQDKAEEEGTSFLEALRAVLEINSPSKKVREIFKGVWEGASEGLDIGKEDLNAKGTSVASSFLDTLRSSGLFEGAREIGSNIMSFFGIGVSGQQENSRLAGKSNADAANAGAGSVDPSPTGGLFGGLFGSGISSMLEYLFGQGRGLSDSAESGAGSVNPSPTGGVFGSQYASGVGSKTGEASLKGQALADNAESGAGTADGYTPGSDFGAGFVSGIGAWLGKAASAAAELAMSAYNALKSALLERSPSRKTKKSGKNFDLGLGVGIEENKDYAISAASDLAKSTLSALDMDSASLKLKMNEIDIPETMGRIYASIDDRHIRVSDKVVSAVESKERSGTADLVEALSKSVEIDYRRLGQEMSKRPIYLSAELDKREVIKLLAPSMDQEQRKNNNLKKMLNGGRP